MFCLPWAQTALIAAHYRSNRDGMRLTPVMEHLNGSGILTFCASIIDLYNTLHIQQAIKLGILIQICMAAIKW